MTLQKTLFDRVAGKHVLITGASSGIGKAVAEALAGSGAILHLVARNQEKLTLVADLVAASGTRVLIHPCDLSQEAEVSRIVQAISDEHGGVDILINNAGRSIRRDVTESFERLHDFRRTMELNYFAAMGLILGFLPSMTQRGYGHVINVLTMGVQVRTPRFAAYVASKSALDAATRSIAGELKGKNLHFTQVYLPLVRTPMIEPTKVYKDMKAWTPEEAADAILGAIVSQDSTVSLAMGKVAELLHFAIPDRALSIVNWFYRREKKLERDAG